MCLSEIFDGDLTSEKEYVSKLHFQITDFRAPFEDTVNYLEDDIIPYLYKVEAIIRPQKADYELTINFTNGNPWVKAVTKGIGYDNTTNFDMTFKIGNENDQSFMSLGKQTLRLYCDKIAILNKAIKNRLMPTLL